MRHVVIPVNVGHCIKTLIWNINMPLREVSIIYFTDIIQSWLQSNPRKFCSIVNRLKTHEMQLCNEQGDMVPSRECCVIFQNLFVTLFANDVCGSSSSATSYPLVDAVTVERFGIAKLIHNLKPSSSPGTHRISAVFLLHTEMFSLIISSENFTQSL